MPKKKLCRIPLEDSDPNDLNSLKGLIESHESLFEDPVLSTYGGDSRYSFIDGSLEIIEISHGAAEYSCQVHFYAGCSDMDDAFDENGSFLFKIENGHIVFELDETPWNVH